MCPTSSAFSVGRASVYSNTDGRKLCVNQWLWLGGIFLYDIFEDVDTYCTLTAMYLGSGITVYLSILNTLMAVRRREPVRFAIGTKLSAAHSDDISNVQYCEVLTVICFIHSFIYFTFHWSYIDVELVMYTFSIINKASVHKLCLIVVS